MKTKVIYWVLIIVGIAISNVSACSRIYVEKNQIEEEEESHKRRYGIKSPSSPEILEVFLEKNYSITPKQFRQLRQTADYLVFWKEDLPIYMLDVAERISSSNNIKLELATMNFKEYAKEFNLMLTTCDPDGDSPTLFYKSKTSFFYYLKSIKDWMESFLVALPTGSNRYYYDFYNNCISILCYYCWMPIAWMDSVLEALVSFNRRQSLYSFLRRNPYDEGYYYRYYDFYENWISERQTLLALSPESRENTYATGIITGYAEIMGVVSIEHDSVEDIEKYTRYIGGCVLFIGDASSSSYRDYIDTISHFNLGAQHERELIFINSNSEEVKRKYGAEENTLILFTSRGEEKFVFDQVPSSESYKRFINENFFIPNQLRRQKEAFVLLFKDNSEASKVAEEAFRMAAAQLRSEALFIIHNVDENSDPKLLNDAGIRKQTTLPSIRFIQNERDRHRHSAFPLEGELTLENIQNGLKLYKEGKLERLNKSQDIPDTPYEDGFRLVVRDTWNDIVLDETKNTFVWAYCDLFYSLYWTQEDLGRMYGDKSDMVFAAIDVCQNDIELSLMAQTGRFYPKGSKDKFGKLVDRWGSLALSDPDERDAVEL